MRRFSPLCRYASLRGHDLRLVWCDKDFWLPSVCIDGVGIPVQTRGEYCSGPFPPGCVQVGASTSWRPAACGLPGMERETATAGARRNERRGGVVTQRSCVTRTASAARQGTRGCSRFQSAAIQAGSPGAEG